MAADTWLKLHTSLLQSEKWIALGVKGTANVTRHCYVTCLLLERKGILKVASDGYIAAHMFMSVEEWLQHRESLITAGLLNPDGSVYGFEEKQLSPEAERKRRQRAKEERDMSRDCPTPNVTRDCHGDAEAEAEAEAEEKTPPTPPRGGRGVAQNAGHDGNHAPARRIAKTIAGNRQAKTKTPSADISAVVDHLRRVTGRQFDDTSATDLIARAMRDDKATVQDCVLVIDYLWRSWTGKDDMLAHVDKTTPFRKANFSRYLDAARAGAPRAASAGSSMAPADPQAMRTLLDNVDFEFHDGGREDAEAWIARQPANVRPALTARLNLIDRHPNP